MQLLMEHIQDYDYKDTALAQSTNTIVNELKEAIKSDIYTKVNLLIHQLKTKHNIISNRIKELVKLINVIKGIEEKYNEFQQSPLWNVYLNILNRHTHLQDVIKSLDDHNSYFVFSISKFNSTRTKFIKEANDLLAIARVFIEDNEDNVPSAILVNGMNDYSGPVVAIAIEEDEDDD